MPDPIFLGVNVDHVATIRQARGVGYPDPVHAAMQAELAGADGITMHLREDRRHIQDADVERFAACTQTKLNFEMAATDEMRKIALRLQPLDICVVPEKREEVTTEGGLDVAGNLPLISDICAEMAAAAIRVSLFVDPDPKQIDASVEAGAPYIELHTGSYADANEPQQQLAELAKIRTATEHASNAGVIVNAGHGLTRYNVAPIAAIDKIHELNIGHSLIADSVFIGLPEAVRQMRQIMLEARQ